MAGQKNIAWAFGAIGILLTFPLLFMDWNSGGDFPKLDKATRVVRYLSAPNQLKRSSFLASYPKGKPSDFVKWMFSTLGTAEWPPREGGLEEEFEEGARAVGIPLIPAGVSIVAKRPDPKAAMQVVVKSDDINKKIIIEGYLNPTQPPALTKQWDFKIPKASSK